MRVLTYTAWRLAAFVSVFLVASPLPVNAESSVLAAGRFEGRSGHTVSGGVTILKTDSGYVALLESDFSLDGAPDPKLGLGKDGYQASTQFAVLRSEKGLQAYELPANIDPTSYNEFWVWCEKFSVPLGVARLTAVEE